MEYLKEKEIQVMNLVVENYLKIGKPISSGLITKKIALRVSPATIRNIMVRLEKHGFLYQPHTSAGRIPSDKGLRFYVNNLFNEAIVSNRKLKIGSDDLIKEPRDFDNLLSRVTKTLSEKSDNMAFVISPRISKINFRHVRFIGISEGKVLIILVTTFNLVLTEVIKTKAYFTQLELDRSSQYLNENFSGKNLGFVLDCLLKEVPGYRLKFENIIHKLIALLKVYDIHEKEDKRIFLEGVSKLLDKPDLFDPERLRPLFQSFEEKAKLARLLSDFISLDRVKVIIGSELNIPDISDCSLILSHYGYDEQILGSLGVIGPKRLPYKQIIPLVDCVAKQLSETISLSH